MIKNDTIYMYNKDIKDILLYAMNHGYVDTTFIKFLFFALH